MTYSAVDRESLRALIRRLPRVRLAELPTPLGEYPRLARVAGVGSLLVKRDDLSGLALGGNKTRLLEFILGDAVSTGCDVLVAGGGVEQSNHALQCVAAANRVGMDAVVVLQQRPDARSNGNALLHEVLGGRTVWVGGDPTITNRTSSVSHMQHEADLLRESGRTPYVLESSLHPLSVVAYLNAAIELCDQFDALSVAPRRIYVTSEGSALGGLTLAKYLLGLAWDVVGLDWRPLQPSTLETLASVVLAASELLGLAGRTEGIDFLLRPSGEPAYGVGRSDSWSAMKLAARMEGLLLDPVYTAKGFAGMLEHLTEYPLDKDDTVAFVHTGGLGAIFAYEAEIRRHILNPLVTT